MSEGDEFGGRPAGRSTTLDLATIVTVLPVIAAAIRVWIFAGGDSTLFRELVRTLDLVAVLVGTAVQMVPGLIFAFVVASFTNWEFRDRFNASVNRSPWIRLALTIVIFVLVFTLPIITAVFLAVGVPLAAALIYWAYSKSNKVQRILGFFVAKRGDGMRGDAAAAFLAAGIVLLASPSAMWLPVERIDIDSESPVFYVGYVLEADGVWASILTLENQSVVIRTAEIESRRLCPEKSLPRLIDVFRDAAAPDAVPGCPTDP